jgi:hypothetical protein
MLVVMEAFLAIEVSVKLGQRGDRRNRSLDLPILNLSIQDHFMRITRLYRVRSAFSGRPGGGCVPFRL